MRQGEEPNPYCENLTRRSYEALTRMSAEHLLTKDLPRNILQWLLSSDKAEIQVSA